MPVTSPPDAGRAGETQTSLTQISFRESGNMLMPPLSHKPPGWFRSGPLNRCWCSLTILCNLERKGEETALQGNFSQCPWLHCVADWDKFPGASGNGHTEIQAWIWKAWGPEELFYILHLLFDPQFTASCGALCCSWSQCPSAAATAFSLTALPLPYHLLVDALSQATSSPRRLDPSYLKWQGGAKF